MRRGAEKVKAAKVGERTSIREWGSHRERKPHEEARETIQDFSLFGTYREKVIHSPTVKKKKKKKAIKYLGENMKVTLPPYR